MTRRARTHAPPDLGQGAVMPIHGRPGSIPARPMPEIPIAETPQSPLPADGPPARSGALIGEIVVELGHADRETVDRGVAAAREQGFRAALGIIRLVKSFGRERVEAACARALAIGARSFTSVNSILKNKLDAKRPADATDGPPIAHPNIRGRSYFH